LAENVLDKSIVALDAFQSKNKEIYTFIAMLLCVNDLICIVWVFMWEINALAWNFFKQII
jgi:hypothetical protein